MKAVRSPGLWRHCAPRTHQRRQKRTSDHHRVREPVAADGGRAAYIHRSESTRTRVRVRSGPPHDLIGISALERQLDNLDRIRYHRFRHPLLFAHMNTVVSCEQFWEPLGRAISAKIGTLLPHRRSGRRARFRLSRGVESSRPPASTFALPKSRE